MWYWTCARISSLAAFYDPRHASLSHFAPKWSEEREKDVGTREKEGRGETDDRDRDSRPAAVEIKGLAVDSGT